MNRQEKSSLICRNDDFWPAGRAFLQGNAGQDRAYLLKMLANQPVKVNSKRMCFHQVLVEKVPL